MPETMRMAAPEQEPPKKRPRLVIEPMPVKHTKIDVQREIREAREAAEVGLEEGKTRHALLLQKAAVLEALPTLESASDADPDAWEKDQPESAVREKPIVTSKKTKPRAA